VSTRREELVVTAARLFAEHGFHGTSMGDLAQAMGVQKGSLYSLIDSKQRLLYEAMRDGADAFHAALDGVPDDATAVERIRIALRGHLRVVAEQLEVATVFTREWRYLEGDQADEIVEATRRRDGPADARSDRLIPGDHPVCLATSSALFSASLPLA
jgi:AcrR family transcriptional regulator